MQKHLFSGLVVVMLGLMCFMNVHAAQVVETEQRESLHGLQGVRVVVEDIPPELAANGLTQDGIKMEVELVLRSSGIRVLSLSEQARLLSAPYLYVNVNTRHTRGLSAICVHVMLYQIVGLVSGANKHVWGATWTTGKVGTVGEDNLHQIASYIVIPLVKEFANDYLSVNPR